LTVPVGGEGTRALVGTPQLDGDQVWQPLIDINEPIQAHPNAAFDNSSRQADFMTLSFIFAADHNDTNSLNTHSLIPMIASFDPSACTVAISSPYIKINPRHFRQLATAL